MKRLRGAELRVVGVGALGTGVLASMIWRLGCWCLLLAACQIALAEGPSAGASGASKEQKVYFSREEIETVLGRIVRGWTITQFGGETNVQGGIVRVLTKRPPDQPIPPGYPADSETARFGRVRDLHAGELRISYQRFGSAEEATAALQRQKEATRANPEKVTMQMGESALGEGAFYVKSYRVAGRRDVIVAFRMGPYLAAVGCSNNIIPLDSPRWEEQDQCPPRVAEVEAVARYLQKKLQPLLDPTAAVGPTVTLELHSDRTTYVAGQRVVITGQLKRLNEGKLVDYPARKRFALKIVFPNEGYAVIGTSADNPRQQCFTDEAGRFRIIPFAPDALGKYRITAFLSKPEHAPLLDGVPGLGEFARVSELEIQTVQPQIDDLTLEKHFWTVVQHYKTNRDVIPTHQIEVLERYNQTLRGWILGEPYPMELGDLNNQLFGFNGYTCVGYQIKTMRLLNRLRFGENSGENSLMIGLEYCPIVRGIVSQKRKDGEHYAVLLYPRARRERWFQDTWCNRVLDPWPQQKAEVYLLSMFEDFYGLEEALLGKKTKGRPFGRMARPDRSSCWNVDNWSSAFPLLGGSVYWNLDWSASPQTYPESPEWGFDRADPRGPILGPAMKGVHLSVRCPVLVEIVSESGERLGATEAGAWQNDIRGSQVFVFPRGKKDLSWGVWLPDGKYRMTLRAIGTGPFHLCASKGAGQIALYKATMREGESAALRLDTSKLGEPMTLPNNVTLAPRMIEPTPPPTEEDQQAIVAKLRKLGNVMISFDDRRPGRPVIMVDYTNTPVADEALPLVKWLPHVQTLGLAGAQVSDAGLENVAQLRELRTLCLQNTRISDAGLAHLARLQSLEGLYLDGTRITDAGLAHLNQLTSLRHLSLKGTGVTDAGLVHLRGLTKLEELDLSQTRVTPQAIRSLQTALPKATIRGAPEAPKPNAPTVF